MKKEDIMKMIDGEVFYRYDYTDFLYQELQKRDYIINKIEKYCNHGIKEYITDDGFVEEVLKDILDILKGNDTNAKD
jgi:hypothetical protein